MKQRLKKYRCPRCLDINPIMELINTVMCLKCRKAQVELIPNGFVVIDSRTWEVLEISKED